MEKKKKKCSNRRVAHIFEKFTRRNSAVIFPSPCGPKLYEWQPVQVGECTSRGTAPILRFPAPCDGRFDSARWFALDQFEAGVRAIFT
jgi:hypothetical protein